MEPPDLVITAVLGAVSVGAACIALIQKDLIRAVFAYAVSSAGVAALFFMLSSPFAGALELTVGAGLVAVLFLVALVLSGGTAEEAAP